MINGKMQWQCHRTKITNILAKLEQRNLFWFVQKKVQSCCFSVFPNIRLDHQM